MEKKKTIKEKSLDKLYMVRAELFELGTLRFEKINEEYLVFQTKKDAEEWLIRQGFVYGQSVNLKYTPGENYWFHQNNTNFLTSYAFIYETEILNSSAEKLEWVTDYQTLSKD